MKKKKKLVLFTQLFIILTVTISCFLSNYNSIDIISPTVHKKNIFSVNTSNWSNATVISDDNTHWNDQASSWPSIATDNNGNIHVVWHDNTDGEWGTDYEIMYANYTIAGWSNATAISDIYGWNNGSSMYPDIATDNNGNLHVVWDDGTDGEWGGDIEVMYANYTASGWSNATVISDIYGWNDGTNYNPQVAVDNNSVIHVVWQDDTIGEWGSDDEIMYVNYTVTTGWSNATCISDYYGWNTGWSENPNIAIDNNGIVHTVWTDDTDGEWGTDYEIMYANYSGGVWSNTTVISDDTTGWNDGDGYWPIITVDNNGILHVVWYDYTVGEWGTDTEIMYTNYTAAGWSNATVISDDNNGWNNGTSIFPYIITDIKGAIHVTWHDGTNGTWGIDREIMYANYTIAGWSNATAISDVYGWNDGDSEYPCIAVDKNNLIHVVWQDETDGEWETDTEIMYTYIINNAIPTSSQPADILTAANGTETINWTLYDDINPDQYRVWANDTNDNYYVYIDWTLWTNNTQYNITINRSAPGIFNYTIEFNDSINQFGNPHTVIVTISDALPTSTHPNTIKTTIGGSETINWTLCDDFGPGQYRVWANDTNDNYYVYVDWTSWTNNTQYNITINRTAPGIYNYTIEFNDNYNQLNTDMAIINITDAPPSIYKPPDINTTTISSDTINWILYDDWNSGYYRIWVNDTNNNYYVWIDWTAWTNATALNIGINRSAIGLFNYTIEFNTSTGEFLTDTVFVNITKGVPSEPNLLPLLLLILPEETNLIVFGLVFILIAVGAFIGLLLIRRWQEG